ncbi:fatty-acid--CoA ligase [Heyndrickxia shackletonii]|uniref:Fatty-acid--CoA ligase n=1 Tax=Heyndrickxia shackletonii TaxID=157838 RepID=A0A0Q3WXH5_9BACI|nr:long-chain fatty acid--CoA ligase [Heyndrickxia shackletonii]KQL53995.1 fatty-acid--CoA ligase [Heyndrickxia shackletonii]NEY97715.1 long-chain fatty acid--CoA ligase [Heyndrickxia shackletonii]
MMDTPLLLTSMMERAEKYFPRKEVISRTASGIHRFTYKEIGERTRRLASALTKIGLKKGDKIGTFAWNHHRHLEAYFAVPCSGAVLHMVNIRLTQEHLTYVINHAEDKILLIDPDLVPIIEKIKDQLTTVQCFVIMSDEKEIPETTLHPAFSYEQLIDDGDPAFNFISDMDERTPAAMCYTSATTGNPKGVVYTHRGIVLHSLAIGLADTLGLCERDVAMPVVPMFHVNAWGLPFAAVWYGTKQVLPGPSFTPKILAELIEQEKVTITGGVPTIWIGLLKELEENQYDISSIRALVCGGAASPKGLIRAFEEKYKVPFISGYGMTETSPIVSLSTLTSEMDSLSLEEKIVIRSKTGLVVPGLDIRVVNENGDVPCDGATMGELIVRGPWIANEYYKDERTNDAFKDGWLYTGDIAVMDADGYVRITDRTKDLIKSGGEWISSVALENALMSHEAVYEAAVIAIPHPKWQERPLACVVLKDAYRNQIFEQDLILFLKGQFSNWWLPDEIIFLKEIPKTSVGKFLKRTLRDQWKHYYSNAE